MEQDLYNQNSQKNQIWCNKIEGHNTIGIEVKKTWSRQN